MFRMPLDTQAEGMGGMYHRFYITVFTEGADFQILSQSIHCLVMQAVYREMMGIQDLIQQASGDYIDFVES